MAGPLEGFRILDLSERSPSAAIAGMVLADFGAEVIRVEPEGGDPIRALDGSQVWLRGQQSVIVGPEQVADGSWQRLRASAEVILDTAQPWTAKPGSLLDGWTDERGQILAVLTASPKSVHEATARRSHAGQAVYGELVEAQYGFLALQDGCREGPIFLGWPHATYGAAWLLQIGILGALFEREHTGRGQVVTTSLLDGMAILSAGRWAGGDIIPSGGPLRRSTIGRMGNTTMVVALFQCGDGQWIQVHTGPRGAFNRLMDVLGREEWKTPNLRRAELEPSVADAVWDYVTAVFKTRSAWEWTETLNGADVCCLPALPPGDALRLEQIEANGLVDVAPDGRRQLGLVAKFQRTPGQVGRGIPAPGEHNASLLLPPEPPRAAQPSRRSSSEGAATERVGPLDGLLVLDFGDWLAGPFSPRLMADLGARVIKIEEPGGAAARSPQLAGFLAVQRGKEGLAIDLKTEEGRAVIYELVKKADIVHHNMRLAATERLGIGPETLRQLNPRIIYCHSSGYGNDGPWAKWPAFEPLHSAITGLLYRTGGPGNPPAHYLTHMDYGCGLTSTVAVLAALVERERTGQGQFLEVPQVGAGMLAMADVFAEGDKKCETFVLDREQRGHAPTNALYRTRTGWIMLACYSAPEWEGVRRALGTPQAQWVEYARARRESVDDSACGQAIAAALAEMTTLEADRRLRAEGVPCMAPTPFDEARLLVDPMFRELGIVQVEDHPEGGTVWEVAHTVRFGNSTRLHARAAPILGQDTAAILCEIGKSDAEIEALIAARVVNAAGRQAAVQVAVG